MIEMFLLQLINVVGSEFGPLSFVSFVWPVVSQFHCLPAQEISRSHVLGGRLTFLSL